MEPQRISQLIPAVMATLGQAVPVLKPCATGEEEKLALAIQDTRIYKSPEENLKGCLRFVFMLIGLRGKNLPDDMEKAFLISFIREHYGGHTPAEVRLAFEMAVTSKLPVDPNCYENFSCAYFARVMNAYRVWSSEQVRRIERHTPPVTKVPTEDELLNIRIEYAVYLFSLINKLPCKK